MASATSTCQACGATYRGRVETCPNCSAKITAAPILLEPGQIIDGKYEILSLLGSGGMGSVFKVRHIHLHTYRTIKVMRRSLMADETYRNRFAREARLATLLNHPNVAVLYDFATLPDGSYYMISELIEGLTIAQWLARYGRFSPPLAVDIALQTLDGLEHIHRAGLLHRDLSSDNIMIASGGFRDAEGALRLERQRQRGPAIHVCVPTQVRAREQRAQLRELLRVVRRQHETQRHRTPPVRDGIRVTGPGPPSAAAPPAPRAARGPAARCPAPPARAARRVPHA